MFTYMARMKGVAHMEDRVLVIASHGGLAEGLRDTLAMVLGTLLCEVRTYCLEPGQSAADFAAELSEEVAERSGAEFVILTDVYGASVFTAMCPLLAFPNVRLFTGMNVAMALSILIEHPLPIDDRAARAIEQAAREGARFVAPEDLRAQGADDEDF